MWASRRGEGQTWCGCQGHPAASHGQLTQILVTPPKIYSSTVASNGRNSRVFSCSHGAARTRKQTHRSTGAEQAHLTHLLSENKRRMQGVKVENSTPPSIPRLALLDAKDVLQGYCPASTRVFWRPRMSMGERACVDTAHVGPVLAQGKAHGGLLRRGNAR